MAELRGIIRLRRFELDEKKRVLAELHRLADELDLERARLDQAIEAEKQVAAGAAGTGPGLAFGSYVQAALGRRKRVEETRRDLDGKIETAMEAVRAAFSNVKTLEQAQLDRDARASQKRARLEGAQLDEIALNGFRRRSTDV